MQKATVTTGVVFGGGITPDLTAPSVTPDLTALTVENIYDSFLQGLKQSISHQSASSLRSLRLKEVTE